MAAGWVWQVENTSRRAECGKAMRVGVYSAGFLPSGTQYYQVDLFLCGFRQLLPPIVLSTLGEVRAPMVNSPEVSLRF